LPSTIKFRKFLNEEKNVINFHTFTISWSLNSFRLSGFPSGFIFLQAKGLPSAFILMQVCWWQIFSASAYQKVSWFCLCLWWIC
jgi:hypothetical protein